MLLLLPDATTVERSFQNLRNPLGTFDNGNLSCTYFDQIQLGKSQLFFPLTLESLHEEIRLQVLNL